MTIPSEITIILQRVINEERSCLTDDEEDDEENDEEDDVPLAWVIADEDGVHKNLGRRRASSCTTMTDGPDGALSCRSGSFPSRWDSRADTVNCRAIPSPRLPRRQDSKTDEVISSSRTGKDRIEQLCLPSLENNDRRAVDLLPAKPASTGLRQSPSDCISNGSHAPRLPQRTWRVDLVNAKAG
jgi:hypothetical protein